MLTEKVTIDFSRLPNRSLAYGWVEGLLDFMFPNYHHDNKDIPAEQSLREQLIALLKPVKNGEAAKTAIAFFEKVNAIYHALINDARFFEKADPAAESIEEVIAAYPGFYAIAVHRIAHELYLLKVPVLPRLISEYAHTKTGIDIHPGASIGVPFFIDHGTGVVVGQTTVIGKNVKLYQGVTLGALAVRKEESGAKRHPTIEDNVIIYAGSCILGGKTTVGHDSVIGGNVWLTDSVLPYSIVYHTNQVKVRDKSELNEVIDFII
ncbi:MAG: serine acetyltransferase [Chitinophagales bacterium]|nr:serine acetyltransferase [Chitinophagales bacterium]